MSGLIDLDAKDLETQVLDSKEPVLVDFWHDACEWCSRLEPELRVVAKEFAQKLKFAKLNVLSSPKNTLIANKFGVRSTPTLVLFCQGRVIEQLVGYRPKDKLRDELQDMLDSCHDCLRQSTPLPAEKDRS